MLFCVCERSISTQSIGVKDLVKATFNTSSTVLTGIIFKPSITFLGISAKSFSFSSGIKTVLIPPLRAANYFSFKPPIGRTLPLKVTSPVIATSLLTGIPVKDETIEVTIAIPAEGPSFGVAPSGT